VPPGPADVCHHACPDTIKFKKIGKPDQLIIRSAFPVGVALDPENEAFHVVLSNANGVVYEGSLPAGALEQRGKKFRFVDRAARSGAGTYDGLFKVRWQPPRPTPARRSRSRRTATWTRRRSPR